MVLSPLWLIAAATAVTTADTQGMALAEAHLRIPERNLPTFWVGDLGRLGRQLAGVKRGEVTTIATTPGRRAVRLVAYGERERVAHLANYNSAVGAGFPRAYMDKGARRKPVILFVGPVHGQETEGLTGLCNLICVMETGRDLRGREQLPLRALGDRCRLLIIPAGNPDGVARFAPRSLQGMTQDDLRFWGQGTWTDHTFCGWPDCKRRHPMVGPDVGFLGCYFNDAGVNPMHDEFMAPMGPEAPAILRVAAGEGPDLCVSLHAHESAPAVLRTAFTPLPMQERVRRLAEALNVLLKQRDLPPAGVPTAEPEQGEFGAPFNLVSALHHVSGAVTFTFECPHGLADATACHLDMEGILDLQLAMQETMMQSVLAQHKAELRP